MFPRTALYKTLKGPDLRSVPAFSSSGVFIADTCISNSEYYARSFSMRQPKDDSRISGRVLVSSCELPPLCSNVPCILFCQVRSPVACHRRCACVFVSSCGSEDGRRRSGRRSPLSGPRTDLDSRVMSTGTGTSVRFEDCSTGSPKNDSHTKPPTTTSNLSIYRFKCPGLHGSFVHNRRIMLLSILLDVYFEVRSCLDKTIQ